MPAQASSSSSSQLPRDPVVHQQAASSYRRLSQPDWEWINETGQDNEFRGRSEDGKKIPFQLPTPSTPTKTFIPLFTHRPRDLSSLQQSTTSSLPPPPPARPHPPYHPSCHNVHISTAPAFNSSACPGWCSGSSGSSGAFSYGQDQEDFDSSASNSAFSFTDEEETEGLEGEITYTNGTPSSPSKGSQEEAFDHNLHFVRKPFLLPKFQSSHTSASHLYHHPSLTPPPSPTSTTSPRPPSLASSNQLTTPPASLSSLLNPSSTIAPRRSEEATRSSRSSSSDRRSYRRSRSSARQSGEDGS